jgi:hypothetical protein
MWISICFYSLFILAEPQATNRSNNRRILRNGPFSRTRATTDISFNIRASRPNDDEIEIHSYKRPLPISAPTIPAKSDNAISRQRACQRLDCEVRSFSFSIDCNFAISSALISGQAGTISVSQAVIYSKPMQIREDSSISSNLVITIYQLSDTDPNVRTPLPGFTGIVKYKDVPSALWAPYMDGDDPARTANPEALRKHDNATVRLAMGIDIDMPQHPEYLQKSNLQQFDATTAFRETIGPGPFLMPSATPFDPEFLAESELLPSAPP